MTLNLGPYAKFITAAAGLAVTVLTQKYGGTSWLPYVVAVAAALGVYGVPNSSPVQELTAIAGEVKSLPEPTHLHIHLDTGGSTPAPVVASGGLQVTQPSLGGGGTGGAGGGVPGGTFVVSGSGGVGGTASVSSTPPPPEFFESNTPASQPGSPSTAAGSAPVE